MTNLNTEVLLKVEGSAKAWDLVEQIREKQRQDFAYELNDEQAAMAVDSFCAKLLEDNRQYIKYLLIDKGYTSVLEYIDNLSSKEATP